MLLLDHLVAVYVLPETTCLLLHHAFNVRLEPSLPLMGCLAVPNALLAHMHPPLDHQAVLRAPLEPMPLLLDCLVVLNALSVHLLPPLDHQAVHNVSLTLMHLQLDYQTASHVQLELVRHLLDHQVVPYVLTALLLHLLCLSIITLKILLKVTFIFLFSF